MPPHSTIPAPFHINMHAHTCDAKNPGSVLFLSINCPATGKLLQEQLGVHAGIIGVLRADPSWRENTTATRPHLDHPWRLNVLAGPDALNIRLTHTAMPRPLYAGNAQPCVNTPHQWAARLQKVGFTAIYLMLDPGEMPDHAELEQRTRTPGRVLLLTARALVGGIA